MGKHYLLYPRRQPPLFPYVQHLRFVIVPKQLHFEGLPEFTVQGEQRYGFRLGHQLTKLISVSSFLQFVAQDQPLGKIQYLSAEWCLR